jgi:hypothetical protein
MNHELIEKNYIILPNFISSERAKELAKDFKEYSEIYELEDDPQVPNCKCKYDYISFIELLCEKTNSVSQIVGETVLPTYSYARIYQKGNTLDPHVDKEECEISLTINLDCDKVWPIWIETPDNQNKKNKSVEVLLNPGDALIFLGMTATHWREKFTGEYCNQVFLHYVRSRGPYFSKYFNKNNKVKDDKIKRKKVESPKVLKSVNPLSDYIKVYNNILSKDECELILSEYKNCNDWTSTRVGDEGRLDKDVRNCDIINISIGSIIKNNLEKRKLIDDLIFEKSAIAAKKYVEDFPHCFLKSDSGYDLLRYSEGGYYTQHTDNYKETPRTLSMSIALNEDFIGGELAFFDREIQIRMDTGSAIVFPSNFMYPHEVMPVIQGTRYVIVTWFT